MKRQSQQVTPTAMALRQVLITDILNVKPAMIKSLFHGQLEPVKAQNYYGCGANVNKLTPVLC
jgi:hypothetical protein